MPLIKEFKVTVKECAEKMGISIHTIYKMIREERSVGKHFKYKQGSGWNIDGRRVKEVSK